MKRRDFLAFATCLPWLSANAAADEMQRDPQAGLHVFGTLPAPDRVQRVFAAGAPAAVFVHALAPDKLLGWPWALPSSALDMLAPAARKLPLLGRLAGRGSTLPLERLLALKPDFILDVGTVDAHYRSTAERIHQQTGVAYVLVDGRLVDSARQLRQGGELLGVGARAQILADYATASLKECTPTDNMPSVYLARGSDGLETPLPGSINGECIPAACARNAARGPGGLARVSREHLLDWAPDAIVTQYAEFAALVARDPFWQSLPAVRAGRFHLAPDSPFGWLDGPPSISRLLGVRWLHQRLHGGNENIDWIEQARDFHQLFYGHAPSREQLASSLSA